MYDPTLHASRRRFIAVCAGVGVVSTCFAGALLALAATGPGEVVTPDMIDQAAALAGVEIAPEQKEAMLAQLNMQRGSFEAIRRLPLGNSVSPAFHFDPLLPGARRPKEEAAPWRAARDLGAAPHVADPEVPPNLEALAFRTARELGDLVRRQKVTSVALTDMYLARLERFDPTLHFVVHLTADRARAQAREADADIGSGRIRGPLQGLPWGAKDLLAVAGYPTTWGAHGFEEQTFSDDAEVVKRLDQAGAVLVAKLSLGALALDDVWYGGRTRNPWNPMLGSSGSSAGSAAATAAGCVAFSIGSETLGSISSPSTRCGATGFRPTFGMVPRTGAMALAWTMDKLGPICRSVEDCALVMQAIYGPDGRDGAVRAAPFEWDAGRPIGGLRIGFLEDEFEPAPADQEDLPADGLSAEEKKSWEEKKGERAEARARREYDKGIHRSALQKLRELNFAMTPVVLPDLPYDAMALLLNAEAAAAFDELTRSGRDRLLTGQGPEDWPNLFRVARFYPAVEYIQANRARSLAMQQMGALFEKIDVLVSANSSGPQLTASNLTGYPAVILPDGLRGQDAPPPPSNDRGDEDNIGGPGTPTSLTFIGRPYEDATLLAFAHAFQGVYPGLLDHPPGFL